MSAAVVASTPTYDDLLTKVRWASIVCLLVLSSVLCVVCERARRGKKTKITPCVVLTA